MRRIIGIDPGSRITGYGVIDVDNRNTLFIEAGYIKTKDTEIPKRLAQIFSELHDVIRRLKPDSMGVEKVFMHRNPDSALKLGQARGAAICAGVSLGLDVEEFSATEVKKTVVGNGHATKGQVQFMIKTLLKIRSDLQEDSADALAVALCLSNHIGTRALSRKNRPS